MYGWGGFYVGEAPNMVPEHCQSLHNPCDEPDFAVYMNDFIVDLYF